MSCMGEKKNAYRVSVGKCEGNSWCGRPRHGWNNIKINLEEIGWEGVLDLSGSGKGQVTGSCETSGSIKCGGISWLAEELWASQEEHCIMELITCSEPSSSVSEFAALICFRRPLFKSEMWSNNTRFHSYTFVTQCTLSGIKTFCCIFGEIIQLRTKCSSVYIWILVFLDVDVMQSSRWVTTFLKNVPTQLYGVTL